MQTSNPRSRLVDAESTKGGWTHNVLFRQKGPFKAPEFTTFVTICTFLLRWMMKYLETRRSYACEARTATRANPIAKPFTTPNQ